MAEGSGERFARAIAAIDEANSADPNSLTIGSRSGPKALLHAELVDAWVRRLLPGASEALLLAARGHHLRRWTVPRASYPDGRAGYLRWRRDLQRQHAAELGDLLSGAGYDAATVERVAALVRKQAPATDPEAQALEDALCLVFLQTELHDLAGRLERTRIVDVLARTARKMSPAGRSAIASLGLDAAAMALLDEALAGPDPATSP